MCRKTNNLEKYIKNALKQAKKLYILMVLFKTSLHHIKIVLFLHQQMHRNVKKRC